jgi:hypothetical protein
MNKSIELKEKALQVIEAIAALSVESAKLIINISTVEKIYRMAHAASETSCVHPDWVAELEETYLTMKNNGIL